MLKHVSAIDWPIGLPEHERRSIEKALLGGASP
jgi:hypothetical protein